MGAGHTGTVGLKNRKRLIRLCEKYGLVGVDMRDCREINIYNKRPPWSDRVGCVTFEELSHPDWPRLEDLVVSISVSTGAFLE